MSKETIIVGKIGGADWVSTNDGGVGQLLFKLQDAKQIKDSYDHLTEENAALREALRLKEAECEALAVDISSIVTYACDACLSGSEQQHVNNLYSAIQDASGKLYNDEPGCSNEIQQAD